MTQATQYDTYEFNLGVAITATFTKFAPKGGQATHLNINAQNGDIAAQITNIEGNTDLVSRALKTLEAIEDNPNQGLSHVNHLT